VRHADRLDRDRLDHERLSGHQEAVLLAVAALELADDAVDLVAHRHGERRVGALVLEMQRALAAHAIGRDPLRLDLAPSRLRERRERGRACGE